MVDVTRSWRDRGIFLAGNQVSGSVPTGLGQLPILSYVIPQLQRLQYAQRPVSKIGSADTV